MDRVKKQTNKQSFFPAMTKIVGTLGPKSRTVDTISACLKAGMSGTSHHALPVSTGTRASRALVLYSS